MRRGILACSILLAACGERVTPVEMRAPERIQRALSLVTDLQATAALVPRGGSPGAPAPLVHGDDGVSFSGFIPTAPGEYTLELVFTGVFGNRADRVFLGRWASDAFTVSAGDTVTAVFSRPLDVIGRPEDHGDDDADRFGLLDELIYGTDPGNADSDTDGVLDGDDCDPGDMTKAFQIATGGAIDDCDGDGARRIDVVTGIAGTDCNDRDATIRPGAEDDCGDQVDQDCNPATCPSEDAEGPMISAQDPADGEIVGCHRRVRARITDPAGVTEAQVRRFDTATSTELVESITMVNTGGDLYEIAELNISTRIWLDSGPERFEVFARDGRGNTSSAPATFQMALDVPAVTMAPSVVGPQSAPFDVTVTAAAPRGIATITLMRAPIVADSVDRNSEVTAGMATASPAVFRVDPTTLADGEYALYPVVVDAIGNRLDPDDSFSLDDGTGGEYETDPYYICVFDPGPQKVPVRKLVVGMQVPGPEPAKMKDHLAEAIAAAAARDPAADLVEIRGWGVETDGRIRLDDAAGGDGKWWRYEFFNFTDDRHITVTWFSAAYDVVNPVIEVEEDSPFGFSYSAFANINTVVDSDAAAAAYGMAANCPPLTGNESESMRWENDAPFSMADVLRVDVGTASWKATAAPPITEIFACE